MVKSEKNKLKDKNRVRGKKWMHVPQTANDRTTGSGMTFWGEYIPKRGR